MLKRINLIMSLRSVPTVSQFCSNYNASVHGSFLLYGNATPKTAIFGRSSSSLFFSSSDTTLSSGEKTEAIDIAPNSVVKTTTSAIQLALKSAVKVFTVYRKPSSFQPWNCDEEECIGSGFVISGKTILTNTHVVAHPNYISVRVQKHGSSKKYKASLQMVSHECDLTILKIDSEEFWEDMNYLDFGDIPPLLEEVVVVGYPEGAEIISVTKGFVSRVEVLKYSYSGTKLMAIQINASINPGNSGGPVIMGNKVVGVAFESVINSKRINYIIPTPVIMKYLNDKWARFCSMNLSYQTMENPKLRDLYKMRTGMTGVLVNQINPLSYAHKFLKKEDVILSIDGVPIGNDSTVPFRNKERIDFTHLVSMKKRCDPVLLNPEDPLLPVRQFNNSYYLLGGFVFVPLTQEYFDRYDVATCGLPKMPTKVGEQIVFVCKILDNDITTGYSELENKQWKKVNGIITGYNELVNKQLKKVNGVQVDNLKHLRELIEKCRRGMLKLEFVEDKVLALCPQAAKIATYRIMKWHNIPSAMSWDLI